MKLTKKDLLLLAKKSATCPIIAEVALETLAETKTACS